MRLFVLSGLLLCSPLWAQTPLSSPVPASSGEEAEWKVYVDLDLWRAYDAIPVSEFEGDWAEGYSPRRGRNTFFQRNRAAAGIARNGLRIGYEVRQDAVLTTDRRTLDAYRLYKMRGKPAPPASFELSGDYSFWQAQGLRAGLEFDGPAIAGRTMRLDVSAAYYTEQRYREMHVDGSLSYPAEDTYRFAASQMDVDSRMRYTFMREKPSASGATVSVAASLPLSDAWTLSLQADDIFSRVRWKNLPTKQQTLNSDVTSYDENGYVNYRPLLSGTNRQVSRTIDVERYTAARLAYQDGNWGMSGQIARYAGETIPTFSVSRRFPWATLRANVETRFRTIGLGIEAGALRLMLQTDNLDPDKAKAQAVRLHYHLSF